MNVKQMVMSLIKSNSNPLFSNLIDMAEKGNQKGVEQFARNFLKEQGRDFDKEFAQFKQLLNNSKK